MKKIQQLLNDYKSVFTIIRHIYKRELQQQGLSIPEIQEKLTNPSEPLGSKSPDESLSELIKESEDLTKKLKVKDEEYLKLLDQLGEKKLLLKEQVKRAQPLKSSSPEITPDTPELKENINIIPKGSQFEKASSNDFPELNTVELIKYYNPDIKKRDLRKIKKKIKHAEKRAIKMKKNALADVSTDDEDESDDYQWYEEPAKPAKPEFKMPVGKSLSLKPDRAKTQKRMTVSTSPQEDRYRRAFPEDMTTSADKSFEIAQKSRAKSASFFEPKASSKPIKSAPFVPLQKKNNDILIERAEETKQMSDENIPPRRRPTKPPLTYLRKLEMQNKSPGTLMKEKEELAKKRKSPEIEKVKKSSVTKTKEKNKGKGKEKRAKEAMVLLKKTPSPIAAGDMEDDFEYIKGARYQYILKNLAELSKMKDHKQTKNKYKEYSSETLQRKFNFLGYTADFKNYFSVRKFIRENEWSIMLRLLREVYTKDKKEYIKVLKDLNIV